MRKQENLKINDKKVIIKELRVKDVYKFGSRLSNLKDGVQVADLTGIVQEILPEISNISSEELLELSFSELEEIEKCFWEVNKSFLRQLDRLGIKDKVKKMINLDLEDTVIPIST